jgi:hypothetical protein
MFGSCFAFSGEKSFSKSTAGGRLAQPVMTASATKQKINCAFKSSPPAEARRYTQLQRLVE